MSRGLARHERRYKELLANADQPGYNNYDGHGNLSEKALRAFCTFFLETALDQLRYMTLMGVAQESEQKLSVGRI